MALALSKLLVTGWSAGPLASQSVIQLVGWSVSWLVLFHLAFCMETLLVMSPLLLFLAFVLFREDCMVMYCSFICLSPTGIVSYQYISTSCSNKRPKGTKLIMIRKCYIDMTI